MAASDYGYYRSDGIQSSGTALRSDGNAYIFNQAGQIYPRQVVESVSFNTGSWGGFTCTTLNEVGGWKSGKARQGYYYQTGNTAQWAYGVTKQKKGHFFFNNGKPNITSVSQGTVISWRVSYAKITLNRTIRTGNWQQIVTGVLRLSNYSYEGQGSFSDCVVSQESCSFNWQPYGEWTVVEDWGNGSLCGLLTRFFVNNDFQSLCLYNGEDSNDTSAGFKCSTNYAGGDEFYLEMTVERTIQL